MSAGDEDTLYKKVPVGKNTEAERCFYLELNIQFDAKDEDTAHEVLDRLVRLVEDYAQVTGKSLSRDSDAGGPAVVLFEEAENDADTALRKLTANKGNKLWIDYLQTQLKAAKGFK